MPPPPADDVIVSPARPPLTDWSVWRPQIRATLLFIVRGGEILLIRKKRGLGAGKVNGPGGKIDPGETPEQCAIREAREELCVDATGVREAGRLWFQFVDGLRLFCHVFRGDDCVGEPRETEEAVPLWTPVDRIPYDEMWADDRHWLPLLLEGKPFQGWFDFDGDLMLTKRVEVVDQLPPPPVFA